MKFEQCVLKFIRKNQLMAPRGLVIVGVSGGADSMALLISLHALRHDLGVQLHVAHFNHRLRKEADQEEKFVADWCKRLNLPLNVERRRGKSITRLSEDQARQMRFDFFQRTSNHLKAQAVALAHTRNDLAETVLMRLMRGSGLYGLRAILPLRHIGGTVVVRPLLGVDRFEVETYLKAEKIPFCTDQTNKQPLYQRNRVRLELLPLLLKDYNPRMVDVLADLAMTVTEDYDFLAHHARQEFIKSVRVSGKKVKLDLKRSGHWHPSIRRLLWRQMAESLTGDSSVLSFEDTCILESLMGRKEGAIDLSHHLKAKKSRQVLEFSLSDLKSLI